MLWLILVLLKVVGAARTVIIFDLLFLITIRLLRTLIARVAVSRSVFAAANICVFSASLQLGFIKIGLSIFHTIICIIKTVLEGILPVLSVDNNVATVFIWAHKFLSCAGK